MPWTSLTLTPPAEFTAIGGAVAGGLHAVKSSLEAAREAVRVASTLAVDVDEPNVVAMNALISEAVGAVESAVDNLLDDAGAYALLVPIPKKGLLVFAPPSYGAGSTFLQSPRANILKELDTRSAEALKIMPIWQRAFDPDAVYVGGNAWFLRTLVESLADAGDDNRPRFNADSRWAYTLLVAGAEDLTAVASMATFLARLLGLGRDAYALPPDRSVLSCVPQNVRAEPSGRNRTAVVSWDVVPATTGLGSYNGGQLVATQYAVIRSTDFRARNARDIADLFQGELREGLEGAFGAKVVALRRYDGVTNRWADAETLEEGKDYFYHVAFRVRAESPDSPSEDLGFHKLSGCCAVRLRPDDRRHPRSGGRAPDWVRTPSVARVIPAIGDFIDRIKEELNNLRAGSSTTANHYRTIIEFLTAEIERYGSKAAEFERYAEQMNAIFSAPSGGLHAYLGTGQGPLGAFISDVAKAFDTDAEDRPAFDNGSEYVVGAVLLAAGPDPDRIARALSAFELFFGAPEEDPVLTGIRSVNATVATQITTVVGATVSLVAFDEAMQPTTGPDAGCRRT